MTAEEQAQLVNFDERIFATAFIRQAHKAIALCVADAVTEERSLWKRKILDAEEKAETCNEKGEALMALAESIRRGQP